MPDVSWRGKMLIRPPPVSSHRQEEKPGEAWVQFDQVPKDPVCFQIVHKSDKKEKKRKEKRKKNIGLCFTEGAMLPFFFCFFLECRSGWSRSLRNWNAECWNSWKGTKTTNRKEEKEDPGEGGKKNKHEKRIRNEYVTCHVAASPDLKNQNVTSSEADATFQPLRLDDNKL